jgi:hypothetical protein
LFLGDFIDRGPDNAAVIEIVRRMIDAGTASAIMGNHERTAEVIDWMKTLPLFLEYPGFRVVHACWSEVTIARLRAVAPEGRLSGEQFVSAGRKDDPFYKLAETTTKGPEVSLPDYWTFTDKDGTERKEVRIQWWKSGATSWADLAISVPDPDQLPKLPLPRDVIASVNPHDAKPVFFGHYWLSGSPTLQAPNALCLDYSAGTDGPLVSYSMDEKGQQLNLLHLSGYQ